MKLMIKPRYEKPDKGDGGIRRVVEAQVKYLPQHGFDIVDTIPKADVVATHAADLSDIPVGKPWVVHTHGLYWEEYKWPNWGARVNGAVTEAMRRCDHVTAPSEWVGYVMKRGMWLRPSVLHHGIDPDLWEPGNNQGYVLWNKARADAIANPEPMNHLAAMCPDILFLSTFGNATKNVKVIGKKPFDLAAEDIRNAGIYLATTRETFGIGTLEAMACAVPVIGWDWAGQAEIIEHGVTGWLSPIGDYDDLKRGLTWCVENRDKVGKAARQKVITDFTWAEAMKKYADVYTRVYERQVELTKAPKVSIISPCHNLGHLLPDMIGSVQDQSLQNWELIIVDDASEDDSIEMAKSYAEKDPRIKVVQSPVNLKLPGALNLGFAHAQGRYVMNLDPDNMIPPSTLKILSDALDNDRSIHISYGRIKFVLEDGITPDPVTGTDDGISTWPPPFNCLSQFMHRNQVPSTSLSRREVLERTGGYRDRAKVSEDAEHWTRAASYGFQPQKVTNAVTYIYRYRPDSKSRGETEPDWTSWMPWTNDAKLVPFGVAAKPPKEFGTAWPVPSYEPALVTVIIPVGDGHQNLVIDALDSVEAQTFRNWRCIVINDTGKELSIPHPWAMLLKTGGKEGPAKARNMGIAISKTEVFVCLDADDILEPQCLEEMWIVWKQLGGTVYSQWWEDKGEKEKKIWNPPDWHPGLLVTQGCIHASCAMHEKRVWEKIGGFDENIKHWEDWDYQIASAMQGVCAHKIRQPLFTYRQNTGKKRSFDIVNKPASFQEMKAKWPSVFDNGNEGKEKLEMACSGCGKKRPAAKPLPKIQTGGTVPQGEATLLEYMGPAPKAKWIGKVTGKSYFFGNDHVHKVMFVYNEDVAGFMALKHMFKIVETKPEGDGLTPVLAGTMEG